MTLPPPPAGLVARPLAREHAPEVFALVAAQEAADIGRVEIELADVEADWQHPGFDVAAHTVGLRDDAGRLVGYAEVGSGERGDAAVHPDHRGLGVGTWLAAWTRDRARRLGRRVFGMPVPQGSPGDRLLTSLGYHVRWTSWVLQLPAGASIVARPLPAGYAVRAAEEAEYPAVHDVVEDAFLEWSVRERDSYDAFAASTVRRPGFAPWNLRVVTEADGAVVGAALVAVHEGDAWISRLAVRADQRHRGLAQALMVDAFQVAREHGAETSGLSTDSRTGALGLYRKVGMEVIDTWVHRAIELLPAGLATRTLVADDALAVHALIAAEEVADSGSADTDLDDVVAEWARPDRHLAQDAVGVVDESGALVAYAELTDGHGYAAVHPELRGRGVGRFLAGWLERRARSLGWTELGGQVYGGGAGDRLLTARGYAVRFTAWDLELPPGAELATRPVPDGVELREAGVADRPAVWTLLEDAFLEWSERERRSLEEFGALMWGRPSFEPWMLRVAVAGDDVVGAVFVTLTDDGDAYVHKVGVRADQRGLGLAQALLASAFATAREHGAATSRLSTDTRTGARGLYERVGMQVSATWLNRVRSLAEPAG